MKGFLSDHRNMVIIVVTFFLTIHVLFLMGSFFIEKGYAFTPAIQEVTFLNPDKGSYYALAMYRDNYTVYVEIQDMDGATNLNYVAIVIEPDNENLQYIWFEWNDTFTEYYDPNGYAKITSNSSDSTLSGVYTYLYFRFQFNWTYPTTDLRGVMVYVEDDDTHSDVDYFNIGIETDLDGYQTSINDTRVNPNQTPLNFTGYLVYDGTTIHPADGNYNVRAYLNGVQKGSSDDTLVDGYFEIPDVTAESTNKQLYYYDINATYIGDDTNQFPALVVDCIEIEIVADDESPAINQNVTFTVEGTYWFDGNPVSGLLFDVTRNGTAYTSSTPFYDNQSSLCTYNYTCISANETGQDLHTFSTNVEWVTWGVQYTFKGMYYEDTGLLIEPQSRACAVYVYFTGNTTDAFVVNGTTTRSYGSKPTYFRLDCLANKTREYWLGPDETSLTVYIFYTDAEYYHIEFQDLADVLPEYEYVSAKRLINGSLITVDKRRIDEENKVVMALKYMEKYTIVLSETSTYVFGDVFFGLSPTVELVIKGINFPEEIEMIQRYIRIYADRTFGASGTGNITFNYQDLLLHTYSVTIYIKYLNGTTITTYVSTADAFSYTWSSASNTTAYWCEAVYNHQDFGTQTWRQYIPRSFGSNPFDVSFLGNLRMETSYLLPIIILLLCASLFSVKSVIIGMFVTIVLAILFTMMGFIPIAGSVLTVGFAMVIMAGIGMAKRRMR